MDHNVRKELPIIEFTFDGVKVRAAVDREDKIEYLCAVDLFKAQKTSTKLNQISHELREFF